MTQKPDQTVPSQTLVEQIDPLRIMAQLPLRPYQQLGDFRCGKGALTIPIAKHTFDGKVYATDESEAAREELTAKLAQTRLSNTVVYDPKDEDSVVDADLLDGALVTLSLSTIKTSKPAMMKRVSKALKRGGWAAIIEWTKWDADEGPALDKRLTEAELVDIGKQAGFRFAEKRDLSSRYFMVLLRK